MKTTYYFFGTMRLGRAKALAFGAAVIATLLFGLLIMVKPAQAKTFTVNSTGDENDLDFPGGTFDGSSDDKCDVSLAPTNQCTLRAAIQAANKLSGTDTIAFNIPGGVQNISPGSALPLITKRVIIDGYTQPGADENTIPLAKDGTNATLMVELDGPGSFVGLELSGDGASNSVIRGLVINDFEQGIRMVNGTGYKIQGNFIGTDPSGTAAGPGNLVGVVVSGANSVTVGGTSPDKRNLISGNTADGIGVSSLPFSPGGHNNKIEGNLIGTQKDGTSPLGNGRFGVGVNASSNTIGDSDPSDGPTNAANNIAFNANDGIIQTAVAVGEAGATGNRILSNSIYSNGGLGIDLAGGTQDANFVTENDFQDPDTGPNRLQNYPEITSAQNFGDFTSINGTLNSTPSTTKKKRTFIIQIFSSPSEDPSHFGEGQTFIGQTQVQTDMQGDASFTFAPFQKVPTGQFITATATNKKTGDTSEFSGANDVDDLGGG